MPEITDGCRKAAEEIREHISHSIDELRRKSGENCPFIPHPYDLASIIARHTRAGELAEALRQLVSRTYAPGSIVVQSMVSAGQRGLVEPLTAEARALLAEVDRDGEGGKDGLH